MINPPVAVTINEYLKYFFLINKIVNIVNIINFVCNDGTLGKLEKRLLIKYETSLMSKKVSIIYARK